MLSTLANKSLKWGLATCMDVKDCCTRGQRSRSTCASTPSSCCATRRGPNTPSQCSNGTFATFPSSARRPLRTSPQTRCYTDDDKQTVDALPVPIETVEPEEGQEVDSGLFDWRRQWYPVAVLDDLPTDRPSPVEILGKRLVLWRDADSQWRAFEDKCPHRGVFLSEGRIEPSDGSLQCCYHGWRFNGAGSCVGIPQTTSEEQHQRLTAVPRACATSFPTCTGDGLLFVWMNAGPDALNESSRCSPKFMKDTVAGDNRVSKPWVQRDIESSWEMLFDNVTDSSHTSFVHHGHAGMSREKVEKPVYKSIDYMDQDEGYRLTSEPTRMDDTTRVVNTVQMCPPNHSTVTTTKLVEDSEGKATARRTHVINVHTVPISKHRTRMFFRIEHDFLSDKPQRRLLQWFPTWLWHLMLQGIFDGDNVLLAGQSRFFSSGQLNDRNFYLAAPSDLPTAALWTWRRKFAPNGVDFYNGAEDRSEAPVAHEIILDRYNQHTKHCRYCSGALKNIRHAMTAIPAVAATAFLALSAMLGQGQSFASPGPLACTGVMALCAVLWKQAKGLEQKLTFVDFSHAEQ